MLQSIVQESQRLVGAAFLAAIDPGRAAGPEQGIGDVAQHICFLEGLGGRDDARDLRQSAAGWYKTPIGVVEKLDPAGGSGAASQIVGRRPASTDEQWVV